MILLGESALRWMFNLGDGRVDVLMSDLWHDFRSQDVVRDEWDPDIKIMRVQLLEVWDDESDGGSNAGDPHVAYVCDQDQLTALSRGGGVNGCHR